MLKSKSKAAMGLFRGYEIKLGMEGFELDPFTDSEQLLEFAKSHLIPLMLDEEHTAIGEQIGIKRTWIVEEIGDEVVGLCYKAWKSIGNIVAEAHKLLNYGFIGDRDMLVNKKCPYCGTEQKGLDLTESGGSFICSKCERHFIVDNDNIKEVTDEQSKSNCTEITPDKV